ncbi:hypothetical protein BOX15_Mlig011955g1, partial [Macrostomum lignano]
MECKTRTSVPPCWVECPKMEPPANWSSFPAEVVFQRHLDNSLSFAQNWHGYVKGFGDPNGNYWMGLEQLLAMTKDRKCKLIYEGVRLNGTVLRATFKD